MGFAAIASLQPRIDLSLENFVAPKPLDNWLRREAAMIGHLARLYAAPVELVGLTSLPRLDGPAAAVVNSAARRGRQGRAAGPPPTALLSLC
jgi:hypothetical protein